MTWISHAQFKSFEAAGTTAHRLGSGSDGWAERLGEDVLLSHKDDAGLAELLEGLASLGVAMDWTPARVFTRFLPTKNAERVSPVLHSGDASLPLETVVTEAGVQYGLDFGAGYSHGLFLDQRLNRSKLRSLRPKRLVNTFAYTCSFAVAAALEGAETVNIDLSRKSLDRGRQNFALNGIADSGHRFMVGDTMEVLQSMARRGEKFDGIILDPPTFSRNAKGRRWRVEDDFDELIIAALEVATTHCAILLSTNCTKLNPAILERCARQCIKGRRLAADYHRTGWPVDFPEGHGASTLWMLLR